MAGLSVAQDPAALARVRAGEVVERQGFRVRLAGDGGHRLEIAGAGGVERITLPSAPSASALVVASAGGGGLDAAGVRRALMADPVLGSAFAAIDRRSSLRLTPEVLRDMQALSGAAGGWSEALRGAKVAKYFAGDPVEQLAGERAVVEVVHDSWLRDDRAIDAERGRVTAAIGTLLGDMTVVGVRVVDREGMVAVVDAGRYSPQEYVPVARRAWTIQRTIMMADDYIVSDQSNLPAAAADRAGFLYRRAGEERWERADVHSALGLPGGSVLRLPDSVPGRWEEGRRMDAVLGEVTVRSQAQRYFEVALPLV